MGCIQREERHAGGNPWDGVDALDALVAAYNNISAQVFPDKRIHCAFIDTPKVASIIPSYTKAVWQVRSPTQKGLNRLVEGVRKCIEGASIATGCQVQIKEYCLISLLVFIGIRWLTGLSWQE